MPNLMIWALCIAIVFALGFYGAPLWLWSVAISLGMAGLITASDGPMWPLFLTFTLLAVLNIAPLRRLLVLGPIFGIFKKIRPQMSATEQAALDAGTVWWDADLFSGKPDFNRLHQFPAPALSAEEQAFLDGPVHRVCEMLDDWKINHELKDLPPDVWAYLGEHGFFGMIIKKEYGGLEFSHAAHARVVTRLASRSASAAVSVMVPNSLGPGELLQHYGTTAQKNYYLPRLAKGQEIPCFALTSPYAGSDAGAIPDYGVVCKGSYFDPITGQQHNDVLGLRLNWEKRWITLAPVATLLGLAFKMHDPDRLLGGPVDIGITCALIPASHPGVEIGRRHYTPGSSFMNGPTSGRDVFIPLDWIIGGQDMAGKGWAMLMDCLSAGRCISLPALSVAAGQFAGFMTGAFARVREQFGLSIGRFEGVDEALARIAGFTYQMDAAQRLALVGLDSGEKPAVISAMLKYHNTEKARRVVQDAMDIHGGKAVVLGPRNYLGFAWQVIPVGITVEGANILTRSMIIFGQGAMRCHPWVIKEIKAAAANDLPGFDAAFTGHVGFIVRNFFRALVLGLTGGRLGSTGRGGELAVFYRDIDRLAAAFALLADMAMFSMGGALKFREKISARLGDIHSNLLIATAVLKRYAGEGSPREDLPLVKWALLQSLHDTQEAFTGVLANLPNRPLAFVLKWAIFPWGRHFTTPRDKLGSKVARLLMTPGTTRERLCRDVVIPSQPNHPVAVLPAALGAHLATEALEGKVRRATRDGLLLALNPKGKLDEALQRGVITADEHARIVAARTIKREAIMVDDFDLQLKQHDLELSQRQPV